MLPFDFETKECGGKAEITFKNVKFKENFGEFESGAEYDEVTLDLLEGKLTGIDMHGNEDETAFCEDLTALEP